MQLKRIIFLRMALLLGLMTILVSGSYALFSVRNNRQATRELWTTRAHVLADAVQRFVLWDDRVALRELLVREVEGNRLLDYAFVIRDGEPYVSTLPAGVPTALLQRSSAGETQPVWEFQDTTGRELYDLAETIGPGLSLHLGLKRDAIDRELRPLLIANLLISLGVVVFGILLAMILARRTTREVDILVEALRHYGKEFEAEEEAIPTRSAEVSELVQSFKRLNAERKVAEAEVRTLNAELERRVVERTAELAAANQELDAFAYSVSHDLRAPLRGIDGFSLVLLEDFGDKLNAEGQDCLRRIRAGCLRMGKLIDDLLYLSRITRAELRRSPVDLSQMARQVADELQQREPARAIDWQIAPTPEVQADPALLRVVFDNLLGNAWKFTARQERPRIEFGCNVIGESPTFFVRDNGAGFDMLYADKLFGAFQRLHKTEEFEGIGIGLATVQRVIRRHGGRVWAEGATGQGATFYFMLREDN